MADTMEMVAVPAAELSALNDKIDRLTALVEEQRKSQRAFEELQQDMIPIANHAIKLAIDELAEIGMDFKMEDLLHLLKRLLRNTHLLMGMMDQLEAVYGLSEEMSILVPQIFSTTVKELDRLEREGYFAMARGGWYIVEQIAAEFGEEDVRALGDNIVLILKTVRNMTQPDIMSFANNLFDTVHEEIDQPIDENVSLLHVLREMNDPKVRAGLLRTLRMLRAVADEPQQGNGK